MEQHPTSLLGAACLWQPSHIHTGMVVYISSGKASNRPGAGCLGSPIISLWISMHVNPYAPLAICLWRLAWGSLTTSLYIHAYRQRNGESKQPARGLLPRPALPSLYTFANIHTTRKWQAARQGGLHGGSLARSRYTDIKPSHVLMFMHNHRNCESKQPAWGGLQLSLCTCEYISNN